MPGIPQAKGSVAKSSDLASVLSVLQQFINRGNCSMSDGTVSPMWSVFLLNSAVAFSSKGFWEEHREKFVLPYLYSQQRCDTLGAPGHNL